MKNYSICIKELYKVKNLDVESCGDKFIITCQLGNERISLGLPQQKNKVLDDLTKIKLGVDYIQEKMNDLYGLATTLDELQKTRKEIEELSPYLERD